MKKSIIIYGPTAIGKSDISVSLAKVLDAEIISADSMQIYKDLNIGSAKITQEEMQGIPHHLLNIRECNQNYSVFDFLVDCKKCIEDIKSRSKNVIICGGTGLYIKALLCGYNCGNCKNDNLRIELENLSTEELCKRLEALGYNLKQDDKNNRRRLIRYIELYSSDEQKLEKSKQSDEFILFGLVGDRQVIYDRINNRVDHMIKNGLIEETKYLMQKATTDCQSMKAIGYKEIVPYIEHKDSLKNCVNLLKQKTRNYAKRQITFMNQFDDIIKIDVRTKQQAVNDILNYIKKNNFGG